MIKCAIPPLPISDATAAFYCVELGFELKFAHRPENIETDPCYAGIACEGVWLHLSSFSGDGFAGGVASLQVNDVDALHAEYASRGVPIDTPPVEQSWDTRKMYLGDADRNGLRFIQ